LNLDADFIIHCGDASNGEFKYIDEFVNKCKEAKKPYVFVLGNHDFYNNDMEDVYKELHSKGYNYLTEGKEYNHNGYTFVGGTLWTNFHQNKLEYSNPYQLDINKLNAKQCVNDFYCIRYKGRLVTPNDYITFFNKDWNWIQQYRNKPNTIVVTHFPLHQCCLDPYWANHPTGKLLNPYFINDLDCTGFSLVLNGHCVDLETEILTESGWKFRKDLLLSDKVYTYNKETKLIDLESIIKITDMSYTGDVYEFNNGIINQRVTSLHRMVGLINNKYTVLTAEKLAARKSAFTFIRAGMFKNPGINLTDKLLELYIAIAADGSLCNSNLVRFSLNKNRKKEYIKSLLNELNIMYRVFDYTCDLNGRSSINFTLPDELADWNIKGLDNKLLKCNKKQFEIILKTYQQTDGSIRGNGTAIYTAKKSEKEILSYLSTINGYSCSIQVRLNHGFSKLPQYQLYIVEKTTTAINHPSFYHDKTTVKNEPFWCITIKNENFIMRRNNKISLTGNTHTAIDTVVDETRFVINPLGYCNEQNNNGFKHNLIIEV
jgi:hypothetical protein